MTEPEGYSTEDDKERVRKEARSKRKATRRRDAKRFEPRHYSPSQVDFARRFNRGISITGGDA